jgi:hypothetical protein
MLRRQYRYEMDDKKSSSLAQDLRHISKLFVVQVSTGGTEESPAKTCQQ